ncbi:MAG: corrinoid protein [candidate division WOR-3 bacterium]|nr:MAG: corrinoid protein [candidate division WOR-3 bacterium]
MEILDRISEMLQRGDTGKVSALVKESLTENIPAKQVLDGGLIRGMQVIGEQYRLHEIFLPDVLLAAKAMYAGMDILKPSFIKEGMPSLGKVVIGTVQGDLHDIGKNLVGIMLKGAGFEVIDLGNNVAPESFVETARKERASVIGMSALLTTTMPVMAQVVELLKAQRLVGTIKTIIGGAPVTKEYAQEIGADAYSFDSADAVETVKALVKPA